MIRLFYGAIDADVLDASVLYLRIIAISYPFLALYNGGAALFRSMGNSKISMQISFLMNVINIVGNAVCMGQRAVSCGGSGPYPAQVLPEGQCHHGAQDHPAGCKDDKAHSGHRHPVRL